MNKLLDSTNTLIPESQDFDYPALLRTYEGNRIPLELRNHILDAFEQSQLSGAAFARKHGIRYSAFSYWRRVRHQKEEARKSDSPFVEAHFHAEKSESPCSARFIIKGGGSIEFAGDVHPDWAARLVRGVIKGGES